MCFVVWEKRSPKKCLDNTYRFVLALFDIEVFVVGLRRGEKQYLSRNDMLKYAKVVVMNPKEYQVRT